MYLCIRFCLDFRYILFSTENRIEYVYVMFSSLLLCYCYCLCTLVYFRIISTLKLSNRPNIVNECIYHDMKRAMCCCLQLKIQTRDCFFCMLVRGDGVNRRFMGNEMSLYYFLRLLLLNCSYTFLFHSRYKNATEALKIKSFINIS